MSRRSIPSSRLAVLALACATAAPLVACSSRSADDFGTDEFYASISVSESGGGMADTSVSFTTGPFSLEFIDLTDEDTLTVTHGEQSAQLEEFRFLGSVSYSANLDETEGEAFVVALSREADDGAPATTITLPGPFTLSGVDDGDGLSRENDAVTVEWTSATESGGYQVRFSGDCIDDVERALDADATSVTLAAGTLVKREPTEREQEDGVAVPDECTVSVSVTRELAGVLDAAYAGGGASGRRVRSTSFTTKP